LLGAIAGACVTTIAPRGASADIAFDQWIATFQTKATARGVSEVTYTRVMQGLRHDTAGLEAIHNQPEFNQKLQQYLNRAETD
jgi:membrane-bound lytic murein transglycosylase B